MDESTQIVLLVIALLVIYYACSCRKHRATCRCAWCMTKKGGQSNNSQPAPGQPVQEGFVNDLEDESSNDLATLAESGSFQEATKLMALEPAVIASHQEFVTDTLHSTSTSSKLAIRSDPNDIVTWVGLRRPEYNKGAQPMEDTRVISSEEPYQLMESRRFCI